MGEADEVHRFFPWLIPPNASSVVRKREVYGSAEERQCIFTCIYPPDWDFSDLAPRGCSQFSETWKTPSVAHPLPDCNL